MNTAKSLSGVPRGSGGVSIMRNICLGCDKILEWSLPVLAYYIFIVLVIMIYEVIMRYFFNSPTAWVNEITQYLFGGCALMLGGIVLKRRRHIVVDVLYELFSPRKKAVIDCFTTILIMIWGAMYVYFGVTETWYSISINEKSFTPLQFPQWPIKLCIVITGILLFLAALSIFIKSLHYVKSGQKLVEE